MSFHPHSRFSFRHAARLGRSAKLALIAATFALLMAQVSISQHLAAEDLHSDVYCDYCLQGHHGHTAILNSSVVLPPYTPMVFAGTDSVTTAILGPVNVYRSRAPPLNS